jgi:hypothetical protein
MQVQSYPNTPENTAPSQIPEELRKLPQWMGTRFEPRKDGKINKPPYRVVAGQKIMKAAKTDDSNWASFEEALAALKRGEVDAIGIVLTEDDPLYVTDNDEIVDLESGEIDKTAAQVIHTQGTYAELSCSGTGVHTVGKGRKRPQYTKCKSDALGYGIEVYDRARFVVMTGRRIGEWTTVEDRQEELDELCRSLWGDGDELGTKRRRRRSQHRGPHDEGNASATMEDEKLLQRARRARTGPKFCALFDHGDTSRYRSPSEADFALLNTLIFWAAGDPEQIARLFRSSALYRPEDKDPGYVQLSVDNALESYVGSFYKPRAVDRARQEEPKQADPLTPYLALLLDPSAWTGRKGASAYKAFTGMVMLAASDGIVDDDGQLRIGCDLRRLAEVAGTTQATLSRSALPHLVQELKLVRWRRGKGRQAGVFVLRRERERANGETDINKEPTHFIDITSTNPETALETLRLLIRMRSGHSKRAKLLRLGMPAMFVTIALVAQGVRRGQNITELVERTGRQKIDLRRVLKRLKAAGIVRELSEDVYRLTDDFAGHYEASLERSGITYAEREQRRKHVEDRRARDAKLPVDKLDRELRGKEAMRSVLEERRKEEKHRWIEEQRQKVGTTAATFLADEMDGEYGPRFKDAADRWRTLHGGSATDLSRAIRYGPFVLRRAAGELYIDPTSVAAGPETDDIVTPRDGGEVV